MNLLEILRKQRNFFIRTADGKKVVTNPVVYYGLEEEALEAQRKIGRQNKRAIIAECKERGIPVPNFRREGIEKIRTKQNVSLIIRKFGFKNGKNQNEK